MSPRGVATVLGLSWLHLSRDRVALVLTFVLPIVFFSIFAAVFGAMDEAGSQRVAAAVALADDHPLSLRLAEAVAAADGLELVAPGEGNGSLGAERARELVASGRAQVAVVVPAGFGAALAGREPGAARVELLADRSHPIALGLVSGVVQTSLMRLGLESLGGGAAAASPVRLEVIDVLGGGEKRPSVAFFAAGLGVLFLLFATAGRSALLIEEHESGVLQRMLASRLSLGQLLAGRWLYLLLLGTAQVTVMFVWAALVFGLELFTPRHLAGFAAMTLATAAAAAAFALVLAAACRSRAQLHGVSAVVILVLAALGGNLFPSFLMPEGLRQVGRATFNAWALEGYQAVFWYDAPLARLGPQIAVLLAFCLAFLAVARVLSRRWRGD